MEGSFLGLGYAHGTQAFPGISQNDGQGSLGDDVFMNQYLQSCLQYHQEQEVQRQQPPPPLHHAAPPQFVAGEALAPVVVDAGQYAIEKSPNEHHHPQNYSQSSDNHVNASVNPAISAEEGRQRAQAIMNRFQQRQDQFLSPPPNSMDHPPMMAPHQSHIIIDNNHASSQVMPIPQVYQEQHTPFIEQRRRGMQREIEIRQRALEKNFQYILEQDQKRAAALEEQIHQAKLLEQQAAQHYQHEQQRRQQQRHLGNTAAGIGTKQSQRAERWKQKEGHAVSEGPKTHHNTAALYISGLPTEGTSSASVKQMLHQVFQAYGTLQKVHLYYAKKNKKELKGDGLIIYELQGKDRLAKDAEAAQLVQAVCSQVSKRMRLKRRDKCLSAMVVFCVDGGGWSSFCLFEGYLVAMHCYSRRRNLRYFVVTHTCAILSKPYDD